jgi:ketosteroid isomerase-like protein
MTRSPSAVARAVPGGIDDWVESYRRSWQDGDEDLISSLYTEDAVYRSSPFRQPFVGQDEIRAYWRRNAGAQYRKQVRFGTPFLSSGDRAVVEWWTTMVDDEEAVTLPGVLLLQFAADGRCSELREYWHVQPGEAEPYAGWGQ